MHLLCRKLQKIIPRDHGDRASRWGIPDVVENLSSSTSFCVIEVFLIEKNLFYWSDQNIIFGIGEIGLRYEAMRVIVGCRIFSSY